MEIVHQEAQHAFVLYDGEGHEIGRLAYRTGGGRLNAMRTFVELPHRNQGNALRLLDALSDLARARHTTIVPICSFVKVAFARHPERYADVTAPSRVQPID